MSAKWFRTFVYAVIVPRSVLPKKIRKIFNEKPVVLEPWDPMYKAVHMD